MRWKFRVLRRAPERTGGCAPRYEESSKAPALLGRHLPFKGRDGSFQGFAEHPILAVGNPVKGVERLGAKLDVDLDIPPRPVPPWRFGGWLLFDRRLRLPAAELSGLRDRPQGLGRGCRRGLFGL